MDLRKLIADYLEEAKMLQVATSAGDNPWICSVWFAADDDLNIYFFSSITRRHSKEIAENPKVAGAIVLPQTPQDKPRGIQLEGVAEALESEEDIQKAMSVYVDRIFPEETIDMLTSNKEKPHKFYRIKPSSIVLFDVVNFPEESRQELKLND